MNKNLKENNFDILRMLLAFMVLLSHFHALTNLKSSLWIFQLSSFAVDAFFVVSGFLVCWSFIADPNLVRYLIRRFFRVYPLYFMVVFFQAVILFALGGSSLGELGWYLFSNSLFMNFLAPTIGSSLEGLNNHNAINGSLWTLKIEVGFYLILPFLMYFARYSRPAVIGVAFILSSLFYVYSLSFWPFWVEQLPAQMRFFVLGVAMCFFGERVLVFMKSISWLWFFGILVFCTLLMFSFDGVIYEAFVYPLLVSLFVFIFAYSRAHFSVPLELSYPIYILHFPVIQLGLYCGLLKMGYFLFFVYVLLVTFVFSFFLNRFVELPSIDVGRSLVRRWS